AMNTPQADNKFVVTKSLTEDGRVGKIEDAQGIVGLRPLLSQRWTPVCRSMILKPGDWLRADLRGANAAKVRFSNDVVLILGPGTLLECISPTQARLHSGQAQVAVPAAADQKEKNAAPPQFELLSPRGGMQKFVAGKTFVHLDRTEKLVEPKQPPKWLAAFEGTSSNESLGSLIVNLPDGRNEPLTVGYHKVSVEIRDQIARTTIEESFVNHSAERLEGVFHFPLPQDASISGFGMWIGDQLVEADIVEKQRAREIYETILREKRDPGLLEWTSGNLFKARVYPIEPNSEKRVKIVYTQVLPLQANQYHYTYSLRSDLLRMHPLRELSLNVTVNSALPLKEVICPTHSARISHTAHSAEVNFTAQEYSPERDFQVVCEIDGKQADVVVVPHRRGDDGYLLVQLTPPAPEGNWQREILPEGRALHVVLLCDTSGSMDSEKRKQQADFVATVLSSLGPKDRFQLAATDVATAWSAPEPLAATEENIGKARDFLERRVSLGWTNLDQAFDTVLRKAPPDAQIVYLGDGILTANDRDPAAFVKRLAKLLSDKRAALSAAQHDSEKKAIDPSAPDQGRASEAESWTLHAVTLGNTSDASVMQGIASVGGGSVRAIGGEQTPEIVARRWLNEIAQPGLRNLHVEFRGVKVAAIYPERLPNLAAGTQQILVGRYLPAGQNQTGEIIVTGQRGAESIRYAAKINFQDAEAGNSFIPRLWAREHLDQLLQQGTSPQIRDDIIALSEEFHIITPYTSLLVLETDADRERFGVKRHYQMRDGEKFFADGKKNADYELAQQQMKRAGDWRVQLRRQILARWARLARDSNSIQRQVNYFEALCRGNDPAGMVHGALPLEVLSARAQGLTDYYFDNSRMDGFKSRGLGVESEFDGDNYGFGPRGPGNGPFGGGRDYSFDLGFKQADEPDSAGRGLSDQMAQLGDLPNIRGEWQSNAEDGRGTSLMAGIQTDLQTDTLDFGIDEDGVMLQGENWSSASDMSTATGRLMRSYGEFQQMGRGYQAANYTSWVNVLFPSLAARPSAGSSSPKPRGWTPEAIALSQSLSRWEALQKLDGGLEIHAEDVTTDPIWKRIVSATGELTLYSPGAWLTKPQNAETETIINYCDERARAALSLTYLLGRTRAAVELDRTQPGFTLQDWSLALIHTTYYNFSARTEKAGDHQVALILSRKDLSVEIRFLIDTERHVLLQFERRQDGKLTTRTKYADFVEAGGVWWAQTITTFDDQERVTETVKQSVKAVPAAAFKTRLEAEWAPAKTALFVRLPAPSAVVARQHVVDGSATFDDRLVMLLHDCQLQQWDDVLKQLAEIEKQEPGKPGLAWLHSTLEVTMRHNEEARQRLLAMAQELVAHPGAEAYVQAERVLDLLQAISSSSEILEGLQTLKPVYQESPGKMSHMPRWTQRLITLSDALNRTDEALALRKQLAAAEPWAVGRQVEYARQLLQSGHSDAAYAWLEQQMARPEERSYYEEDELRTAYADFYREQARWADLLKFTTAWIARDPRGAAGYQYHLAALIYNERMNDADALARKWLTDALARKWQADARQAGRLPDPSRSRLQAAIRYAEGNANGIQLYRTYPLWYEPLLETAEFFCQRPDDLSIVQDILQSRFGNSEAGDRLRAYFLSQLQADLDKLSPRQINYFVNSVLAGQVELAAPLAGRRQFQGSELPVELWQKIAASIHARWEKTDTTESGGEQYELSEAIRQIDQARFPEKLLPFLRERLKSAPPDYRSTYLSTLFNAVIEAPWSADHEREALELIRSMAAEPA
ncbi:MAG TPA: VIT domain-containing protein, partial [Pirellulales bacterium]|nr:VIT domain-containing protein [Pirellulales bacterium]